MTSLAPSPLPVAHAPGRLSAAFIARELRRPAPTPEQVAIIEATLSPGLVVAGAGSGKTETMAARVVWLVANGLVAPEQVLGLTFTRKAAGELSDRVRSRLRALDRAGLLPASPDAATDAATDAASHGTTGASLETVLGEPTVATYHSYAASVLADHGLRIGVEPRTGLLGEAAAFQLAAGVVEGWDDLGDVDKAPATVVDAVLSLSSELAEHLVDPAELERWVTELVARVRALPPVKGGKSPMADVAKVLTALEHRCAVLPLVRRYAERKRELEVLDHGDQVALAARVASTVPTVGLGERARFAVVLLDEYQDTSHAQLVLLRALFGGGHPVTAVGDPHQSIYGWRGASAGNLQSFPEQFPDAGGRPATVLTLSTSWRNDAAVLEVANALAGPLRAASRVPVPQLVARPDVGPGRVRTHYAETVVEEAGVVAGALAAARAEDEATGRHRSMAVLCRKRSQFDVVEQALRARGLPVEVVGLGGLLARPEVVDLVAALRAVHDPSRGDALLRLLTGPRWRIGVADLDVLASWARVAERRARRGPEDAGPGGSGEAPPDPVEAASIVDALDDPPPPGWVGPGGAPLSQAGRARLAEAADLLRRLRSLTALPLPDLVAETERALLLDVEVAARPGVLPSGARASLDAFADVAATFADGTGNGGAGATPGLGAFLAWLTAAEVRERGLTPGEEDEEEPRAPGEVEPNRSAVQLLTVHAAKGLEWDVVAVPGLSAKTFPSCGATSSGWLTGLGSLPYPLRGDAASLPELGWATAADAKEAEAARKRFLDDCGAHELAEERRLVYVAATRARELLVLTGAWWALTGKQAREPSTFLREVWPGTDGTEGTALPDAPAEPDNPFLRQARSATWPYDPLGERRPAVQAAADAVRAAMDALDTALAAPAPDGGAPHAGAPWAVEVERLLAERHGAADPGPPTVRLPAHLSASRLVQLAADPAALALAVRRPVPEEPRPQTRRGTAFHAWLERRFSADALFDLDDLPGADDIGALPDAELPRLQAAFEASEWAGRTPSAVEVDVETPLAGIVVRGRIDAVFDTPAGGVEVVDWKTGRPPTGSSARAAAVQLAAYRLAWSRLRGVPLERVSAAFFYASTGETVRPVDLLDEAGLEALLLELPEGT